MLFGNRQDGIVRRCPMLFGNRQDGIARRCPMLFGRHIKNGGGQCHSDVNDSLPPAIFIDFYFWVICLMSSSEVIDCCLPVAIFFSVILPASISDSPVSATKLMFLAFA